MKKIDIITRHAVANYGSLLQAFATQTIFKKLGFSPEIIDYIPYDECIDVLSNTYARNSRAFGRNKVTIYIYIRSCRVGI